MRLIAGTLVVIAMLIGAGALSSDAVAAPHVVSVEMAQFAFTPATASVHTGDTVTWTNHDTAPHDVTVTSGPVAIHSPLLNTGQTWSYTFTVAGTYDYICSIHPDMHAVVTVAPAPVATPTRAEPAAAATTAQIGVPQAATGAVVHHSPRVTTAGSTHPAVVAATSPPPTTTATTHAPVASTTVSHPLKPLLLVAGLVAAVATFCLLVLAARPDDEPTD